MKNLFLFLLLSISTISFAQDCGCVGGTTLRKITGTLGPNGNIKGVPGEIYQQRTSQTTGTFWVKKTGNNTNAGWVEMGTGTSSQWSTLGNNIYNNNSGNVGIGKTTPSAKLEVSGDWSFYKKIGNDSAIAYAGNNFGNLGVSGMFYGARNPTLQTEVGFAYVNYSAFSPHIQGYYLLGDFAFNGGVHKTWIEGFADTSEHNSKLFLHADNPGGASKTLELTALYGLQFTNGQLGTQYFLPTDTPSIGQVLTCWDNTHVESAYTRWETPAWSVLSLDTAYSRLHIKIKDGTEGAGKIATSDANGNLTWQLNAAPNISSGAIPPASTPGKVGDIYIDAVAKKLYFAVGTGSSADWEIAN